MKTAYELLTDLLRHTQPPHGRAIVLTEQIPEGDDDTNWIASTGVSDLRTSDRYSAIVVAKRKSDPRVDWSAVSAREGRRKRIARWLSEVEGVS